MSHLAPIPNAPNSMADFIAARRRLEATLDDPAQATQAHYLLWEICQAVGDPQAALDHLRQAVRRNPVQTRHHTGTAPPVRTVLALAAIGDFQANLPLSMLFDATTQLHTLWIGGAHATLPDDLPDFDCAFIAIGEDRRHTELLHLADRWAATLGRPVINRGARIAELSRDGASRLLADLPDLVAPHQTPTDRASLLSRLPDLPFLIRPLASHAGLGLARIDTSAEAVAYLDEFEDADRFYIAPFIDFANPDGLYRKARIVFVDRQPYPVHLAVHDHWAVWYYNARMDLSAEKRAEEAAFLTDMPRTMGDRAMRALYAIGQCLDLDYVGLDCAVLPDGRLLVFEVETGLLVHDNDEPTLFAYRKPAIARIVSAVNTMLDRCRDRSQHSVLALQTACSYIPVKTPIST